MKKNNEIVIFVVVRGGEIRYILKGISDALRFQTNVLAKTTILLVLGYTHNIFA